MNRDEQRDRAAEQAPAFDTHRGAIYPIDTQAQGTWCAVNTAGIVFSLLNRYDKIGYQPMASRGQIILQLLDSASVQLVLQKLQTLTLADTAPFSLYINTDQHSVLLHWNGRALSEQWQAAAPYASFSSSALQAEQVLPWRQQQFAAWVKAGAEHTAQGLPTFNILQPAEHKAFAPFMSRPQACTKSITQFTVTPHSITSKYWAQSQLPQGAYDYQTQSRSSA